MAMNDHPIDFEMNTAMVFQQQIHMFQQEVLKTNDGPVVDGTIMTNEKIILLDQMLGEIYGGKKVSLLFQLNHLFRTNQP